jgi:predicted HTH domain antitoxin
MNLILDIPDELAERLSAGGAIERQALEALAVEAYRAGRLSKPELRRLLGFGTRATLDGFLKARGVLEPYDQADLERDREDLRRIGF